MDGRGGKEVVIGRRGCSDGCGTACCILNSSGGACCLPGCHLARVAEASGLSRTHWGEHETCDGGESRANGRGGSPKWLLGLHWLNLQPDLQQVAGSARCHRVLLPETSPLPLLLLRLPPTSLEKLGSTLDNKLYRHETPNLDWNAEFRNAEFRFS